eukprot:gene6862-13904_t
MKNTTDLNGNMIKKISSGGGYLIGRTHGGVEEEFQTHFLPICFANDIPKIKPYDGAVDDRVRVISYNKVYVENPTNEFELKMDVNIKDEIKSQRFQRMFVGLLIQQYVNYMQDGEPDEPIEDTNVLTSFLKDFTVTNNKESYIKSSEIKDWLEIKKLGVSMEKFSKGLKPYCTIKKLDEVENKKIKIGGKAHTCWFGVSRIIEEIDDGDEFVP